MKPFAITKQKDAIEKYICEIMDRFPKTKLSGEDEIVFNFLILGDEIPFDDTWKGKPDLVKMIEAKIETFFDFKLNDSRITTIIAQISKSFGFSILYLVYLKYLCKKNNVNNIDMNLFLDWFKDGFFSKEQLEQIWKEQKVDRKYFSYSDNLIDYKLAYESLC